MESSDSERSLTSPSIVEAANNASLNLVNQKSKEKYTVAYTVYMDWCKEQKTSSHSENVLLAYFQNMSIKYKSSTLWAHYSMLKAMLSINNGVDIGKYSKLRAFLKRKSDGYKAKKSKVFTTKEIDTFIKEAPDNEYLFAKVLLIMGITGACRRDELYKMKIHQFKDLGSALLIHIPNSRRKTFRKFTITGDYADIVRKYWNLRPSNATDDHFFLNYQKGKCTVQKIGINKIGNMGKQIASYLKLPNPQLYTGLCFRRSSTKILIDNGEYIRTLKRHGGWCSTTVADGYIEESLSSQNDTADEILGSTNPLSDLQQEIALQEARFRASQTPEEIEAARETARFAAQIRRENLRNQQLTVQQNAFGEQVQNIEGNEALRNAALDMPSAQEEFMSEGDPSSSYTELGMEQKFIKKEAIDQNYSSNSSSPRPIEETTEYRLPTNSSLIGKDSEKVNEDLIRNKKLELLQKQINFEDMKYIEEEICYKRRKELADAELKKKLLEIENLKLDLELKKKKLNENI